MGGRTKMTKSHHVFQGVFWREEGAGECKRGRNFEKGREEEERRRGVHEEDVRIGRLFFWDSCSQSLSFHVAVSVAD